MNGPQFAYLCISYWTIEFFLDFYYEKTALNIHISCLCGHRFSFLWKKKNDGKWWEKKGKWKTKWLSCGKCILNFIRKWQIVSVKWLHHFAFPRKCIRTKTLCMSMPVCGCSIVSDSVIPWKLPGSSVHEILQSGILKWVANSYSTSRYVVVCNCGVYFLF